MKNVELSVVVDPALPCIAPEIDDETVVSGEVKSLLGGADCLGSELPYILKTFGQREVSHLFFLQPPSLLR